MDEILKKPYVPWMEEALKTIVEVNPTSIYIGLVKGKRVIPLCWRLSKETRGYILQSIIDMGVVEYIVNHKAEVAEMMREAFKEHEPDEYNKYIDKIEEDFFQDKDDEEELK